MTVPADTTTIKDWTQPILTVRTILRVLVAVEPETLQTIVQSARNVQVLGSSTTIQVLIRPILDVVTGGCAIPVVARVGCETAG